MELGGVEPDTAAAVHRKRLGFCRLRASGTLSHRTGCYTETIRYNERIGLMLRTGRSDGDRLTAKIT